MSLTKWTFFAIITCCLLVVGCSSNSKENEQNDGVILGKFELSDGWARPGSAGQTSGAYLRISNGTATDDTLMNVKSDVAKKAEIHESYETDAGVMGMRPAGPQVIKAGHDLILEPGGFHIMLTDMKRDLAVGDSVSVSLEFSRVGTKTLTLPVQMQK